MHRELLAAAEHIEQACGQLDRRYHEPEALALMRALGQCDRLVAQALPFESTKEQQAIRWELHRHCTHLATAIRHAIADPTIKRHRDAVVERARQLRKTLRALRPAMSASRMASANDDHGERPCVRSRT